MEPIVPRRGCILPHGTKQALYAAQQPQYDPLPALVTPDGKVLSQWLPSIEELQLLNRGEPISIVVWSFGAPLQPMSINVGPLDLT